VMRRTRVKFCGMTRVEDAVEAVHLGVDAIGLVCTRRSRRFVEPEQAAAIRRVLPPSVVAVTLFMDDDPEWIGQVVSCVQPDLVQLHGSEDAAFAEAIGLPYLKAVPMADKTVDLRAFATAHAGARALLLDGHASGQPGGSGVRFDWTGAPQVDVPLVLAGGLDASNVAQAIMIVRPYAVDVSSGIESSPGVKDFARMRAFMDAVRVADGRD
jgi:phosphoribosylanthranilate isomerase